VAELLGAPLQEAVGVALLLSASAQVNGGFFDPAWMEQPNFADVLAVVPRQDVASVIGAVFAGDFDDFRRQAAEAPPLRFLDRYAFNPLAARPFVRLDDGRLLAPVPQLITRKLSPAELYYLGLKRWGLPFARDMGELFEDYVGRQLGTLPGVTVHPEVEYAEGKNTVLGVDWIVVSEDSVLLVEAKATRVPAGARAGQGSAEESFRRTLGRAFGQISRTHRAICAGQPEFSAIPADRPIHGLVATLDSWYIANSPPARALLPEPAIPTLVASTRCLEHLVAIGQRRPAAQVLAEILGDTERRTWDLSTALAHYGDDSDDNPILRAAWNQYPFGSELTEDADDPGLNTLGAVTWAARANGGAAAASAIGMTLPMAPSAGGLPQEMRTGRGCRDGLIFLPGACPALAAAVSPRRCRRNPAWYAAAQGPPGRPVTPVIPIPYSLHYITFITLYLT
jgi:hypothetical protein